MWQIVACDNDFITVTAWVYYNMTLDLEAVLWSSNGGIKFQSCGKVTQWHGSFTEEPDGSLLLVFNCRGKLDELKTAVLFLTDAPELKRYYEGYDCMGNHIAMQKKRTFLRRHGETGWHVQVAGWHDCRMARHG